MTNGYDNITVMIDSGDLESGYSGDSNFRLFDNSGTLSFRLHADRVNDAPELSMFCTDSSDNIRETVQVSAQIESVDVVSTHVGNVVNERQNETLPLFADQAYQFRVAVCLKRAMQGWRRARRSRPPQRPQRVRVDS